MVCGGIRDGITFCGIVFQVLLYAPGSGQFSHVIIQHPEPEKFVCDGTFIPSKYKCDYYVDCKHGEDERNCAGSCDFESNTCGYGDGISGAQNVFQRTQGKTELSNVPTRDHTTNTSTGYFMMTNEVAGGNGATVLKSQNLSVTSPQCIVEFNYYYASSEKGTMEVGCKQTFEKESIESVIWRKELISMTRWQQAAIAVGQRPGGWFLSFTADHKHVAIDDIIFRDCSYPRHNGSQCKSNQFKCGTGPCINSTQRCDFSKDCLDGSDEDNCEQHTERCNFEAKGCHWLYQGDDDDFNWMRHNGSTNQLSPSIDHTTGTSKGHYLAVDASKHKENETATLLSIMFSRRNESNHEEDIINILSTRRNTKYTEKCYLTFFYYMDGGKGNRLVVKRDSKNSHGTAEVIKTFSGQNDARWSHAIIYFATDQNFQVIIEAKIGAAGNGVIAIDDVVFSSACQPKVEPCGDNEFSCGDGQCVECTENRCKCNFTAECRNKEDEKNCNCLCSFEDKTDDGMCRWRNDESNLINWAVLDGRATSNETGPRHDHTLKNTSGHYLCVDANKKHIPHPKAKFVSVKYNHAYATYNCSFSLWYNMYHRTECPPGKLCDVILRVYYRSWSNETSRDTKLWEDATGTDIAWKQVLLQLPHCPHDFSIIIESEQYWNTRTDLAIDDLKFNCTNKPPRQCDPETEFICNSTKQCAPKDSLCDIDRNCCDDSDENEDLCKGLGYTKMDFENGIVKTKGWRQLTNDDFDFIVHNGPTTGITTGPPWDHTFQEEHGKYVYMKASATRENQTAAIGSPTIKATNSSNITCRVRFWYYMYGRGMGSLRVHIAVKYGKPSGPPVWSLSGDQGKEWKKGSVQLNSGEDFQVLFIVSRGPGPESDLAMDDVSFTPGCDIAEDEVLPGGPTVPPHNRCHPNFLCRSSNKCIPWWQKCDFLEDCAGGEDESQAQCGYPQGFDKGVQPWKYPSIILGGSVVHFKTWKGPRQTRETEPSTDAAKNKNGSYIYFDAKTMAQCTNTQCPTAVIDSPWYQSSYADCKMNLWYHMNVTDDKCELKVVLITQNEPRIKGRNEVAYGTPLLDFLGNAGTKWHELNITIGRRREPFKIRILAKAGDTHKGHKYTKIGDIAIDEVNFLDCGMDLADECNNPTKEQFLCKNGQCVSRSKVCDFVDDCGDLSDEDALSNDSICYKYSGCNFEEHFPCNYTQDNSTDDFDWSLNKGFTDSVNTGPEHDHTLQTKLGSYMFIEASRKKNGSKARLRFFPLTNKGACKAMFYYHMYGEGVGHININVFKNGTSSFRKRFKDESKFLWREGVVDLSNETGVFQVEFEGVVGSSYYSDIAIDDIIFNPDCGTKSHQIFPTIHPCPGNFTCTKTGNCVAKESRCNGTVECKDKSDESDVCSPNVHPKKKHSNKDPVTVAAVVLALLLLTITAIIVVMRRRNSQKFHLFSIFYDPTANQGMDSRIVRQVSELSVISAVSNPTYGTPTSEKERMKGSDKTSMFTCSLPDSSSPVYQEPFYISKPNLH